MSSYYLVNPKTKNIPYSGTRVSELGSSSRSFIPCPSSDLTPYLRRRRTLDITSPYILMDHDVVEGTLEGVNTSMIVVERVVSLEFFYNEIFDKFMNDSGLTIETINSRSSEEQTVFLASWWEHIACSFQKILGYVSFQRSRLLLLVFFSILRKKEEKALCPFLQKTPLTLAVLFTYFSNIPEVVLLIIFLASLHSYSTFFLVAILFFVFICMVLVMFLCLLVIHKSHTFLCIFVGTLCVALCTFTLWDTHVAD